MASSFCPPCKAPKRVFNGLKFLPALQGAQRVFNRLEFLGALQGAQNLCAYLVLSAPEEGLGRRDHAATWDARLPFRVIFIVFYCPKKLMFNGALRK